MRQFSSDRTHRQTLWFLAGAIGSPDLPELTPSSKAETSGSANCVPATIAPRTGMGNSPPIASNVVSLFLAGEIKSNQNLIGHSLLLSLSDR
ncbi:hypothetical protein [Egbenema bharatensis]|uniref:hypothetical protein n=1 Tax=Egbenema bharatensis TaxID=3463334 RepID=UPI003A8ABEFB